MDYLQWAVEMFSQDRFATEATGIEIVAVDYHYAKCKLPVQPYHKNATGMVMGGAIFTLADFTFAIASNAGSDLTVTSNAQINFLAPAKGDLVAEAHCIKDGKSTCYYEVEVKNDQGKLVAKVTANGFKVG